MPSNVNIIFRRKIYDSTTDNANGIVVFDNSTGKIYVGGSCYGSDVKDAVLNSSTNVLTITKSDNTTIAIDFNSFENNANKVTSLSSSSTDTQYPSAKCVYDLIGPINTALDAILNGSNS